MKFVNDISIFGDLTISGTAKVLTLGTSTGNFITQSGNILQERTSLEVLSDIGGVSVTQTSRTFAAIPEIELYRNRVLDDGGTIDGIGALINEHLTYDYFGLSTFEAKNFEVTDGVVELSDDLDIRNSITTGGTINLNNNFLIGIKTPTDTSHGANKWYVDNKIISIDTSLNNLWIDQVYQDVSITNLDVLTQLHTLQISNLDSSLDLFSTTIYIDASLNDIRSTYISDASLSTDFYWNASNLLEVSTGFGGATINYVDGSLAARDTSIAYLDNLTQTHTTQISNLDTSVSNLDTLTQTHTTQISNLDTSVSNLDTLTQAHTLDITNLETSTGLLDSIKLNNTTDTFTGVLTLNGSLNIFGDIYQDGSSYITHAENIETESAFITMRQGAVVQLEDGSISGVKITKPDGITNVIFGAGNDAIMRVGWEGSILQAIATREDSPTDTHYAYWDDSSSMLKTYDIIGNYIDPSLNTLRNNLDSSVSALDTLTQTHTTQISNLDTSISNQDLQAVTDVGAITTNDIEIGSGSTKNATSIINTLELQNSLVGAYYKLVTDDYIEIADNANLDVGTSDFSQTIRFNPNSVSGTQYLINKEAGGIGYGVYLVDDDIYIRFDDGTTDVSAIILTAQIVDNTWYSLNISFDRDGNATAILNGTISGTVDISTANLTLNNAGAYRIGSTTAGASFFDGEISMNLHWNKTLTTAEMLEMSQWDSKNPPIAFADVGASQTELVTLPFSRVGSGWVYDGAGQFTGTATTYELLESITDYTYGANYRVSVEITGYTSGDLKLRLGAGGTQTASFSGVGVYTFEIEWDGVNAFFEIDGNTAFTGVVDNIKLTQIGNVLNLNESGMTSTTWLDNSGNSLDGTVSGAELIRDENFAVDNLFVDGFIETLGDIKINPISGSSVLLFYENNTAKSISTYDSGVGFRISTYPDEPIYFQTNRNGTGSIDMAIDNKNLGIGTTTPLSKLSINGGLHVGGDSDAGDNNLLVDGTGTISTIANSIGDFLTAPNAGGLVTQRTAVQVLSDIGAVSSVNIDSSLNALWVDQGYQDSSISVLDTLTQTHTQEIAQTARTYAAIASVEDYRTRVLNDGGTTDGIGSLIAEQLTDDYFGKATFEAKNFEVTDGVVELSDNLDIRNNIAAGGTVSGADAIDASDYVTKSQLDSSIAAGDLQQVTDIGNTTTNSISITDGSLYVSGNVGIGITSPASKLTVQGTEISSFTGTTTGTALIRTTTYVSGNYRTLDFAHSTDVAAARIGAKVTSAGSYLQFGTSNSYASGITNNAMTVDYDGNVGIGTTTPTTLLDVSGNITSSGNIYLNNSQKLQIGDANNYLTTTILTTSSGSGFTLQTTNSVGDLMFNTNSTEAMRIDSSGNVGIGTTSPNAKLEIDGTSVVGLHIASTTGASLMEIDSADGDTMLAFQENDSAKFTIMNDQGESQFQIRNGSSGAPAFFIAEDGVSENSLYLQSGGNVGIGTTNPSAKLYINGDLNVEAANISYQENLDVDIASEVVATLPIATYTAVFFDYSVKNGSNVRAGTVMATHDGTSVVYTDTATTDLGDTSDVVMSVDISGTDLRLIATVATSNWIIKTLVRGI